MKIYNIAIAFLANDPKSNETPEGYCPNCWGRQEYQGKFFEAVKREGVDTQNISEKRGWIQAYAERHLSGITLSNAEPNNVCASCGMKYIDEK